MTTVYAPGRVELLGNHTDYNGGFVLAFAVERGITVTGSSREDDLVVLKATDLDRELRIALDAIAPVTQGGNTWANYPLGVVDQLRKRGLSIGGCEIGIRSDLPMGAGLSSSAALEVATGLFLNTTRDLGLDRMELARVAQAAEHTYAGVKCGLLDQLTSIFGQKDSVVFIDCGDFTVDTADVPEGACFVVANSGVSHSLVAGEYNERRESCHAAAKALGVETLREATMAQLDEALSQGRLEALAAKRARHVIGENERVLRGVKALHADDLAAFGELMFASHESSRVNFENSCAQLDTLVAAARAFEGCYGARLSGGGFGGATINLVQNDAVDAFVEAMHAALASTSCLVTKAAEGARVLSA